MAPPVQFKKQPNGTFAPINGIGPHLASSVAWKTWAPVDKSGGVALDIAKMAQMPTSAQECGPVLVAVNEHGLETTRHYEVAWSDADDFLRWCYGYSYVNVQNVLVGGGGNQQNNQLRRVIPAQDVNYPYLFCDDCRLEQCKGAVLADPGALMTLNGQPVDFQGNIVPAGDVDQGLWPGIIYTERVTSGNVDFQNGNAYFRVRYRPRPYPVRNDDDTDAHPLKEQSRFVQLERHYAIQALALAKIAAAGGKPGQLQFVVPPFAGNQIPEAGVLLMPVNSYQLILHEWPYDIGDVISSFVGKVNSKLFQPVPGVKAFGVGTALCQAPESRGPTRNDAGAIVWRHMLRFDVRPNDWNSFPGPDGNFYEAAFGGLGGTQVYKSADFADIFAPQSPPNWS